MIRTLLILGFALLAPQWTVPLHVPVVAASGTPCTALPFTDNFTRANGPLGAPWTQSSGGTFVIASNQMAQGLNGVAAVAWPTGCPYSGTTQYAQITLGTLGSSTFGPAIYLSDANNYYYLTCTNSAGSCSVASVIGGSGGYVGSPSNPAFSSGDTLCIEVDSATTIKVKTHGSYFGTWTVSAIPFGGGGVWVGASSTTQDTFSNFQTGNGTCP
jgi:hypothetical protein